MYTNGVSLQKIANHVRKTLRVDVNRNTIHRLMRPQRKNTKIPASGIKVLLKHVFHQNITILKNRRTRISILLVHK